MLTLTDVMFPEYKKYVIYDPTTNRFIEHYSCIDHGKVYIYPQGLTRKWIFINDTHAEGILVSEKYLLLRGIPLYERLF